MTSPYGVKDLTQGPVRYRVVSLGGFASVVSIGRPGGTAAGSVPAGELSTNAGFAGVLVRIIRRQSAEGQGRPVDANGRYESSFELKKEKKKKGRAPPPPLSDLPTKQAV